MVKRPSEQESYTEEQLLKTMTEGVPGKGDESVFFAPISMSGLEEFHAYSIDERLYEYFEFAAFKTIDETRAYIEKLQGRIASKKAMYWFLRRRTDNKVIGTAGLLNLNFSRRSIEWGYGMDPETWGHGYILQVQEMLKTFVFESLKLNRLYGITMVENERTIASVTASGMKSEGIQRQYYCKNGVYHDGYQYGMVWDDYYASKSTGSCGQRFTLDEVVAMVARVLSYDTITENSSMDDSMTWDSLSHMSIMVEIFEKTGVRFSPQDVANAQSVKKIHEILNRTVA